MDECCIICLDSLETGGDTVSLGEKGLKTVKACSIIKCDGLEKLLNGVTFVKMHTYCRKRYTKKPEPILTLEDEDCNNSPNEQAACFANACFVCGKKITYSFIESESKKPAHRRNRICTVRNDSTKQNLIRIANKRNDQQSIDMLSRIANVDLVKENARYHLHCYGAFRNKSKFPNASTGKRGRPKTLEVSTAMEHIFRHIENHGIHSQFSIDELKNVLPDDYVPHDKTMREELISRYNDNIVVTFLPGRSPIITFKDDVDNILYESWKKNKERNNDKEETAVLKAAGIVRKDIESKPYEIEFVPLPNSVLSNAEKDVPDSLVSFLETVICKDKNEDDSVKTKILEIAQAIIAAAKPQSST